MFNFIFDVFVKNILKNLKKLSSPCRQLAEGDNDMKSIKYFDGKKTISIAVNEETAQVYQQIKRKEWQQERASKRHEYSFEVMAENGMQFIDEDSDIEEQYIEKEDNEEREQMLKVLQKAVVTLKPDQQEIIKMAFTENKSHAEIGQALGVSKQAIQQRIETILKRLKTFF